MLTYKLKPGKQAEFLEIFRIKAMPAHAEIRMKIPGPWLSIEDPDTFFFIRGFPQSRLVRADGREVLRRRALENRTGAGVDADHREIRRRFG
jgi:hypothetical protein